MCWVLQGKINEMEHLKETLLSNTKHVDLCIFITAIISHFHNNKDLSVFSMWKDHFKPHSAVMFLTHP